MKKIATILILAFLGSQVSAQIIIDKVEEGGGRLISTKSQMVKPNPKSPTLLDFSLSYTEKGGVGTYFINIMFGSSSKLKMDKDALIAIRFLDDDVFKLKNFMQAEDHIGKTSFYGKIAITSYSITATAELTEDEYNKLASCGVKKIRFALPVENLDFDFTDKSSVKLYEFLYAQKNYLDEAIKTKKDIMSDF